MSPAGGMISGVPPTLSMAETYAEGNMAACLFQFP